VRQLDSVIEKAVLLAQGEVITPADLDLPTPQAKVEGSFRFDLPAEGLSLDEFDKEVIARAMEKAEGNMAGAAKLLGTTYRTVEYRVKKYGIPQAKQRKGEADQPKR
jgi:DNA-binding NtrC family response regulator